jgi:hypothetical protein
MIAAASLGVTAMRVNIAQEVNTKAQRHKDRKEE